MNNVYIMYNRQGAGRVHTPTQPRNGFDWLTGRDVTVMTMMATQYCSPLSTASNEHGGRLDASVTSLVSDVIKYRLGGRDDGYKVTTKHE